MTRYKENTTRTRAVLRFAIMNIVILGSPPAQAGQVSEQNAIAAIETWVRHVTADGRPDAAIEHLEPYVVNGQTVAYIAHLQNQGFCICGADDSLLPVYLYNPEGTFDPDNPNYQFVLDSIATRLDKVRRSQAQKDSVLQQYEDLLTSRRQSWNTLAARQVPSNEQQPSANTETSDPPTQMMLPITSKWHQGSPYNDQVPAVTPGSDEHCKVGCVATAFAQIMYYWKWPDVGFGIQDQHYFTRTVSDHPETWDCVALATDPGIPATWAPLDRIKWIPDDGGQLCMRRYWCYGMYQDAQEFSDDPAYHDAMWDILGPWGDYDEYLVVDFGATTYDWTQMHDEHADNDGVDDSEVAKLSYHAGVAIFMSYGYGSSSSYNYYLPLLADGFFRYDWDMEDSTLNTSDLIREIRWMRPPVIGGHKPEGGGHSWVVCGYNEETDPDQFLMNMGWGGGCTDWYTIDEVYPDDQDEVFWIAPRDVVRFVGGGLSGNGQVTTPYLDLDEALDLAPDDSTLIVKAGITDTVHDGIIDRPLTIKGYDVTIGNGGP